MNSKIIDLLKEKKYFFPEYLIKNYSFFKINEKELIILIYLINKENPIVCDYKQFSFDLNKNVDYVMNLIQELKEKGILEVKLIKNSLKEIEERIFLDSFYNKMFIKLIEEKELDEKSDIFSIFEKELGRTLSPIEFELINGWISMNYSEEIIIEALKEAVFNGVNNFRYMDKILFEWNKKNIKTKQDLEKNKKNYKKETENIDVPDYDWLNNE